MTSRTLRWITLLVVLLALYAAAGFWGVPALVRWQLPRVAAAKLERPASVGQVRFNPFTLRLRLRDLRLTEADGSPLFAVRGIDADLDWRSVVQRAWTLRHVRIDAPQARLAIARDGRFNISAVLDTLQRHQQPGDKRESGGVPRVVIEEFALTQGRLEWDDRQVDSHAVLAPMELHFARLSTLPNDRDPFQFTADVAGGGRMRWRGEASVQPMRASGEIVFEDLPLPMLASYLKPYARVVVASGKLSATLPYEVAYDEGRVEAKLHAARLAIAELAAGRDGSTQRFVTLREAEVRDVEADLVRREAVIGAVRLAGGDLGLRRDARGAWDVAQLLVERASAEPAAKPAPWKLSVRQVQMAQVGLRMLDESVRPAVTLMAGSIGGQVRLDASQAGEGLAFKAEDGALQVAQLTLAQAGRPPLTLERLDVEQVAVDLGKRHVDAGRIALEGGQLRVVRDAQGRIDLLAMLPKGGGAPAKAEGPAWTARAAQVALSRIAIDVDDQGSGIRTQLQDVTLKLEGAGTDLAQPVRFEAGLRLREGGQLAVQGRLVPASRSVDAQLQLRQLAVATAQPLLARHVRLKLASGTLDTQGRLEAAFADGKPPVLRYTGRAEVANLRLDELDGNLFARWKAVSTDRLAVTMRGLEVPELRVAAAEASLIIDDDRTFNATRLLVRQPAPAKAQPATSVAAADDAPFAVRIARVRLQDARLDFVDHSLRPQFGARIYALNGVVTGLSTQRDARSQVTLDGRVGDYGLARVRGALNPFSPRDSTDMNVVFRNIDMVPASPYAMKFAGYRIAEGKISLDLRYRVHDSRLEGDNKIVIDKLKLGERVDSPDALKLPLELAIAILKDDEGRIDLGVPVTGDLNDPQFSYGAVMWKALGNVLSRVVTAPFRALAGMFGGGSGEKLQAIEFDPGSDRILPPEREKLARVGQMLAKRGQLRLTVPAQFSEAADGAALRTRAVREEIARRSGARLAPGESPGPLNFAESAVRGAVREMYTQRFGAAAWEQAKVAAETGRPRGEASGASGTPNAPVPAWRRLSNFVQGEPQVADAVGFYRGLVRKLEQEAPLAPDALARLGEQRAKAVVAALTETGVDASRATTGAPAPVAGEAGKPVPLKLELAAAR